MSKNDSPLPEFGASDLDALLQGSDRSATPRGETSAGPVKLRGNKIQPSPPRILNRPGSPHQPDPSFGAGIRGRRREIIRIKRQLSALRETSNEPADREVLSLGEQLKKCSPRESERAAELICRLAATQAMAAVDVLSDYLDHKVPAVRCAAVRALADLPFARGALLLADFLSDEFSADLRAVAFAGITRHFAVELLSPLLNLASASAIFLSGFRDAVSTLDDEEKEKIYGQLTAFWWSEDVELAVTAVRLSSGFDQVRMLEDFAELFQHENPRIRCAAVDSLAAIQQKKSVWLLNRAVADPSEEVRLSAIRGMIRHHSFGSIERLLDACGDESLPVRREAARTLSRIAISDLLEKKSSTSSPNNHSLLLSRLADILQSEQDPDIRRSCIDAMGQLPLEATTAVLKPYLDDADTELQNAACIAFCRSCTKSSIPLLRPLLTHVDAAVRLQAVDAVARLNVRSFFSDIQATATSDFSVDVRAAAIRCLGKIGGSKAIKTLQESLTENGPVQCQAVIALGKTRVQEAVPVLRQQLQDVRPEVCALACTALAELGAKETIPLLLELSEKSDAQIRRAAVAALTKLGYKKTWLGGWHRKYVVPTLRAGRSLVPAAAFLLADKRILVGILLIAVSGFAYSLWQTDGTAAADQVVAVSSVRDLCANFNGDTLLVLRKFGVADVWAGDTGKLLARTSNVPKSAARCVIVGQKAVFVASSKILIWDWKQDASGQSMAEVKRPDAGSAIVDVAVAEVANRMTTLNAAGLVVAYHADALQPEAQIDTGIKSCKAFVLNAAADWVCIVTPRFDISVFDISTGKNVESLPLSVLSEDANRTQDVHVAFRKSDSALLVAPDTGPVSVVDIAEGNLINQIQRESRACLVAAGFDDDSHVRLIDSTGHLSKVRISDGTFVESAVLAFPESLTFTSNVNGAQKVLVGSEESRETALFDATSGQVAFVLSD